jgi:hypothetical protein
VKRKTMLIVAVSLLMVLLASSIIAVSQAWWKPKPEFVGYDLKVVFGPPTDVNVDNSGAPALIVLEHVVGAIEANVTIEDMVYSYPDDFDITVTHHVEFNAITGKGLSRNEGTITFKLHGRPTLTFWGVARLTDFRVAPDGTFISPEDFRAEGDFKLTGNKRLSDVEGFGLGEVYFAPPEYLHQYVHQFGYIKGWSL